MTARRFPPPWTVDETDACFIVRDHVGQALGYVYFEDEPGRRTASGSLTLGRGAADRGEYRKVAGTFGSAPILENHRKQWPMAMLLPARYTPRNKAELAACLIGLGDHRLVKLNPDAAKLLGRYRVHTVKDVLALPAWPYGRLRIAIERWPLIEVMIEPV